ncbi:MAG TPA: hypothetical protein VNK46_08510 [Nitrospiraceae bacterium]|jgi:uncharacterized protein YuzE|nr:hypothetical protein [Nitrospiraceae bacterium]
MRMHTTLVMSTLVASLAMTGPSAFADQGGKPGARSSHMHVSGVVSKVESGVTTVKTPWGTMRIASSRTPEGLEVGEEVEMTVNENNAVIDVHRKGDKRHAHRFVTGDLKYTSPDHKAIKLWTPEGEKTFDVQAGRSKLSAFQEGEPVTIELNEAGKVIDIHRFTVEMEFDVHPRTKPGYVIQVDGTVTKMDEALVYVKTPAAQYRLMKKYAPADAAVGDHVSLWINEEGMVIDVHGKDKATPGTHRLIFGKLIRTGPNKNLVKLATPEGVKEFPLDRMEVKTKPIADGSNIVVELNEQGNVIDVRLAQ